MTLFCSALLLSKCPLTDAIVHLQGVRKAVLCKGVCPAMRGRGHTSCNARQGVRAMAVSVATMLRHSAAVSCSDALCASCSVIGSADNISPASGEKEGWFMHIADMQDLIGQRLYVLRVGQINGSQYGNYSYRIYPVELKIQEIRLGEAMRDSDAEYYGPGFVTWLCRHDKGYVQAFSPIGDEILAKSIIAGRNTRAFLNKDDLYQEAEILKDCVLKNYKHVKRVEIRLPEHETALVERIQDATERAKMQVYEECKSVRDGFQM